MLEKKTKSPFVPVITGSQGASWPGYNAKFERSFSLGRAGRLNFRASKLKRQAASIAWHHRWSAAAGRHTPVRGPAQSRACLMQQPSIGRLHASILHAPVLPQAALPPLRPLLLLLLPCFFLATSTPASMLDGFPPRPKAATLSSLRSISISMPGLLKSCS